MFADVLILFHTKHKYTQHKLQSDMYMVSFYNNVNKHRNILPNKIQFFFFLKVIYLNSSHPNNALTWYKLSTKKITRRKIQYVTVICFIHNIYFYFIPRAMIHNFSLNFYNSLPIYPLYFNTISFWFSCDMLWCLMCNHNKKNML